LDATLNGSWLRLGLRVVPRDVRAVFRISNTAQSQTAELIRTVQ